jgi:plastocyanin
MNRNMLIIIGVVLVLLVGGVLFISNSQTANSPTPTPEIAQNAEQTMSPEQIQMDASQSGESTTSSTSDKVKEFTVMGSAFKFEPATLTVNKGDKVKITFKNLGGTHDFTIDELDVKTKTIQSGQEETVEFTASQAGSFEYYCSVANHRQMGMKGTLVVK